MTFKEMSTRFAPKIISAKKMSRGKLKRSACRQCEKCLREDCGECVNCMDKPKFGGLNKIKQRCMERRCEDMSLIINFNKYPYFTVQLYKIQKESMCFGK